MMSSDACTTGAEGGHMADAVTAMPGVGGLTAEGLRAVRFAPAKGFGRGYDQHEVDQVMAGCAAV